MHAFGFGCRFTRLLRGKIGGPPQKEDFTILSNPHF
jgi:hypothetical protein